MGKTLEFEYHTLELLHSDAELSRMLGEELTKDLLNLDKIGSIIKKTEKMDPKIAIRKVKHAVENQFPSAKEAIREIAVQNTIDAYFDFENFLAKRNEKISYPLKVDVTCTKKGQDVYDLEVRDYAIGMNLYDVLYKYFTIGDTSKQDNTYHIGGHGRGAKAGLNFCKNMAVESFGKKTVARNNNGKYTITVGEKSDIREGTKITLEDLVMKEDPFLALKEFAGKITSQFDFRFNGIKVNQKDNSKELGRLPLEEKRKIKGTEMELTDVLLASSKHAEGLELKQSVMTVFEKPIDIEYVKRTIGMPTGYLLSRSRNEVPKTVQDVLENKNDKAYKKFFKHLYNNLSKIGAFEFRFMDSFSKREDMLSKVISGSYKTARNTALAFMIGASLFLSVEHLGKPAFNEITYLLSNNRSFSTTKFFSKAHRPIADVGDFMSDIFGGSWFFSKIKKNPLGYYYIKKESRNGNYYSESYEAGGDLFFKLTSYNTLLPDGSWDNVDDSCLTIIRKETDSNEEIKVKLNLDAYKKKSVLPMPIGYVVSDHNQSSVWYAFYPSDKLPYDTWLITESYRKPKGEFPVYVAVVKKQGLVNEFENPKSTNARTESINKKFTKVPFNIVYPEDLEEKLKKIDDMKLTSKERVSIVTDVIRDYLIYNSSVENNIKYMGMDNVVTDPLKHKKVDCDVANGILAAILRDRYKIPTRLAVGVQGINGVLNVNAGHGVCEAYIPHEGWTEFDATPPLTITISFGKADEGPSRFAKFLEWLRKLALNFRTNSSDKDGKGGEEKVINEYTSFSPTGSWSNIPSKIFRKALYYGSKSAGFVFDNYDYFLFGLGGLSVFGAYRHLRRRRKTELKNLPLVDVWVKEDPKKVFEEKISINQGIKYTKMGELLYDKQAVENGLEKLANSEYDNGRYVLDYNFYNTIIEMSGSKKQTRMYYKKEEDEEKVINPTILKGITFGDETLKEKNSEEKVSAYSEKISALQDIVTGICKSNKMPNVHVSGEYKFKNPEKVLSFKNGTFKPKVYVNLDNEFLNKNQAGFYLDEKILDSLVFATALATERNIGELNEMKKNYLNKMILGEQ